PLRGLGATLRVELLLGLGLLLVLDVVLVLVVHQALGLGLEDPQGAAGAAGELGKLLGSEQEDQDEEDQNDLLRAETGDQLNDCGRAHGSPLVFGGGALPSYAGVSARRPSDKVFR